MCVEWKRLEDTRRKRRKVITEECTRGLQEIRNGEQNKIGDGGETRSNANMWKEKSTVYWNEVRKRN
jgi:hypothetical protein